MIQTESIPFTTADIDQTKIIEFNGSFYHLRLRKNLEGDFYTIEVFDSNKVFLFSSVIRYKYYFVDSKIPEFTFNIYPYDLLELSDSAKAQTEITDDNLGVEVLLLTSISVI